jgi:hypothetical protein
LRIGPPAGTTQPSLASTIIYLLSVFDSVLIQFRILPSVFGTQPNRIPRLLLFPLPETSAGWRGRHAARHKVARKSLKADA